MHDVIGAQQNIAQAAFVGAGHRALLQVGQITQGGADHHATGSLFNACGRKNPVANKVCYKSGCRPVIQRIGFVPLMQLAVLHHANLVANGKGLQLVVGHKQCGGTIPNDNPFVGRSGVRPEIWSYGHRNMQAAALDPQTGQLWTVEHGAAGGDELNHPEAGKNYGWPVITYGKDYNGSTIGEGVEKAEMEQPVYYWDPVIAPSGMLFYTGDKFPAWKNSVFIGGLASNALVRLEMSNGKVVKEERYLHELKERIRDVQQGPDGYIYVITDNNTNGRVLRVLPARS